MTKQWCGDIPTCDCCGRKPTKFFVDGQTRMGAWAIMCEACWPTFGAGKLGTGYGQKYNASTGVKRLPDTN